MPVASESEMASFAEFLRDLNLTADPRYDSNNDKSVCYLFAMPLNTVMIQRDGDTQEEAYSQCIGSILKKLKNLTKTYKNSRATFLEDALHTLHLNYSLQKRNLDPVKHVVSLRLGNVEPYSLTSDHHSVTALKDQIIKRFIGDLRSLLGDSNMSPSLLKSVEEGASPSTP